MTAAELAVAAYQEIREGTTFEVEGTVTYGPLLDGLTTFAFEDESGAVALIQNIEEPNRRIKAGDKIRARGFIRRLKGHKYARRRNSSYRSDPGDNGAADARSIELLSHGSAPTPALIDSAAFYSGKHDFKGVRIRGIIRSVISDEIDPNYTIVTVSCENSFICAFLYTGLSDSLDASRLVGYEVLLTGLCHPCLRGHRRHLGRILLLGSANDITMSNVESADPFDAPLLDASENIVSPGVPPPGRRKVIGRVLAKWGDRYALLQSNDGEIIRLNFRSTKLPACDEIIEASGLPHTDIYHFNLSSVDWRPATLRPCSSSQQVESISAESILADPKGRKCINVRYHGATIRLQGTVSAAYDKIGKSLSISSGRFVIPVDVGACQELASNIPQGSDVQVTGICVITSDILDPTTAFPHLDGFMVVTRSPTDLVVLRRPSWWTPTRFLVVIGSMLVALIGIIAWNLTLRRLAERRGKALASSAIARAESELKVYERTRLAVELHDSIAQNLTGVSFELDTAADLSSKDQPAMLAHLRFAQKTLKSCRDELRNCLWDLRSQALEEGDMNSAIRRTLEPHIGDRALSLRFNVPRESFTDNTAHALLRIIRELTVNAIRHGHAQTIRIAGCIEGNELKLSVADDGIGFDPDNRPGVEQGHYGLQGVSERIDAFEGRMTIKSSVGKGTKVTISMRVKNEQNAEDKSTHRR